MNGHDGELPPEAYAAALAGLPGMGPVRLRAVLHEAASPAEAWAEACSGRWKAHARAVDADAAAAAGWAALQEAGVGVHVLGRPGYPPELVADHEAPAVLFSRGDLGALPGRRVAIVGTRNCTRYGRDVALGLGRDLATAGVVVVSGLALGVDGAAHTGVLTAGVVTAGVVTAGARGSAPPVAVVGSGLDVVYPRRHARLWHDVAAAGVVLSEAPLGATPEPWRFPVRNRIIAALAEVVIVVESPHAGGSRHTVEAAIARGVPVMAVPGPVRSPTSELPNALLAEGCHPARDALDVLVALDLSPPARPAGSADPRPPPGELEAAVLDALGWERTSLEEAVGASGKSPAEVGLALAHLERDGWVVGSGGCWERLVLS